MDDMKPEAWNFDRTASSTHYKMTVEDAPYTLATAGQLVWAALPMDAINRSKLLLINMIQFIDFKNESDVLDDLVNPLHRDIEVARSWDPSKDSQGEYNFKSLRHLTAVGQKCYAASCHDHEFDKFEHLVEFTVGDSPVKIEAPEYMFSNICYDNGRIWMTSYDMNEKGEQYLFWYDIASEEWHSTAIPAKHQRDTERFVSRDDNGFILVTNANDLSVSKFTNDGVYVNNIRLAQAGAAANRYPTKMTVNTSDRTVFVASFQGMISKLNAATNTVTAYSTGLGEISSFTDGGQYLWVSSEKRPSSVTHNGSVWTCVKTHMSTTVFDVEAWAPGGDSAQGAWAPGSYYVDDTFDLIRIDKVTQQIRHFGTEDRDVRIQQVAGTMMSGVEVNSVIATQPITYITKDGNRTIQSHIFSINADGEIIAVPQDSMWRPNLFSMKGVAMVSFGTHDYIGE